MHQSVQNLTDIENKIKSNLNNLNIKELPKIIAVSKTFSIDKIQPLINHGHLHFGENKVQEAIEKWSDIKKNSPEIQLHMIGKLQSNKVKFAIKLFDFIHSVDNKKLMKKISDEQKKLNKKIQVFLQVNIGNEPQKSGIEEDNIQDFINYSEELNLNLLGLMCIPPADKDPIIFFEKMNTLNKKFGFKELSMGMSSDYLKAVENFSTYLRIGSSIFGQRY
jgi:pyridoxal phosphate enzyme (YggS family)